MHSIAPARAAKSGRQVLSRYDWPSRRERATRQPSGILVGDGHGNLHVELQEIVCLGKGGDGMALSRIQAAAIVEARLDMGGTDIVVVVRRCLGRDGDWGVKGYKEIEVRRVDD